MSYGSGSIFKEKRDGKLTGKWVGIFPLGDGKRSPKFRAFTKDGVRAEFDAWKKQCDTKAIAEKQKASLGPTVREYFERWWEVSSPHWAVTTKALNEATIKYIQADQEFLEAYLSLLQPKDVQDFLGRIQGRSAATIHRIFKLVRAAFQAAVENRELPINPAHMAKSQRPKKPKSNVVSLTDEHERQLLRYLIDSPELRALTIFALDSGCRQQEVFGLLWDAVNLKTGEVQIFRTLDTIKGQTILKELTKSDSSKRVIQLSKRTVAELRMLRSKAGSEYVFTNFQYGTPWTRNAFRHRWDDLLKSAGLPQYGFHSCRHTMATRLLRAGMYITAVSRRLGHARPSITLDIYSNAVPADQDRLAAHFDAFMTEVASPQQSTEIS